MSQILSMAFKDLKILVRDKTGAFFILVFPILMGVFFGLMTGGMTEDGRGKMKVAVVDQDQSEISKKFIDGLRANASLEIEDDTLDAARDSVRLAKRVAVLVVPEGFGDRAGIFWGEPASVYLGVDDARSAEKGMLQGLVMQSVGSLMGERMTDSDSMKSMIADSRKQAVENENLDPINRQLLNVFFGSLDTMVGSIDDLQQVDSADAANPVAGDGFQFAEIKPMEDLLEEIEEGKSKELNLKSRWDISFPQGMMWGVLGCVAGFAISIARENTLGTMTRLKAAPISRFQILAGKAMACFLATLGVVAMLTLLGVALGMRPGSYPRLVVAALCVAFCFVGIMMSFSVLGKTEQSVSGAGWAINMVMAMFGGCMMPVMFMPGFMQKLSMFSPIRWAILSLEGAIWRDFSWAELVMPCGILIGVGVVGMVFGSMVLSRRS